MEEDAPESLLDASHVIPFPVVLGDIFLTNRNPSPSHTHVSDSVNVVLVKVDLQRTEVTLRPLRQTPLLHDLLGSIQLHELTHDVAVEDGELPANVTTVELARCCPGERCCALRVRERVV